MRHDRRAGRSGALRVLDGVREGSARALTIAKIDEVFGHLRVVGAEGLLVDGERRHVERHGVRRLALGAVEQREPSQIGRDLVQSRLHVFPLTLQPAAARACHRSHMVSAPQNGRKSSLLAVRWQAWAVAAGGKGAVAAGGARGRRGWGMRGGGTHHLAASASDSFSRAIVDCDSSSSRCTSAHALSTAV